MLYFSETIQKQLAAYFLSVVIFLILPSEIYGDINSSYKGIITSEKLYMRARPDRNSKAVAVLNKGTVVPVFDNDGGWIKVVHNGHEGYLRNKKKYVRLVPVAYHEKQVSKKEIEKEIKKQKAEIKENTVKEAEIINGLNEIDLSMNSAKKKISVLKSEQASIEDRIKEAESKKLAYQKEIKKNEVFISKRLTALYKLSRIGGKANILASSESVYDFIGRKNALQTILESDEKILLEQIENHKTLADLEKKLNVQKQKKNEITTNYKQQLHILSLEKYKKSKLLKDIQSKKNLQLAVVRSLEYSALQLEKKIETLHIKTKKKKFNNKQKLVSGKEKLRLPVKGKIISKFGPEKNSSLNITTFKSGIDIQADMGEPIEAVTAGKILYADWFKGYGNMIIIDHGDKYYTIYAHAEELFKSKGDFVKAREVIGTVGDTGSLSGPALHFEVRHGGKSIDPLKWLNKG